MGIKSAIVIGGGVIGLAIACALQRRGCAALVIDPAARPRPASWGNAGHLAIEHVEPLSRPGVLASMHRRLFAFGGPLDFVWRDAAAWAPWALAFLRASTPSRFGEGVGAMSQLTAAAMTSWRALLGPAASDLIIEDGHWSVWDGRGAETRARAALDARTAGPARHRPIADDERSRLSAAFVGRAVAGARYLNTGAVVDPALVLEALAAGHAQAGGTTRVGRAVRIVRRAAAIEVSLADGETAHADAVIVAAGVQSGALLVQAGLRAPLIAERGYHIEWPAHDWPSALSPIVLEDRAVVVSRFGVRMRATSFVEFGCAESAPDRRKWQRLERHVRELGILRGEVSGRWMGARPTLPDYLPAIGGSHEDRIFYAVGHSHLGLTLAAVTADMLVAQIEQGHHPLNGPRFSLDRFRRVGETRRRQ